MMRAPMPEHSSPTASWLALALVVAVLCNGATAYLKRTGVLDEGAYRAYWAEHCARAVDGFGPDPERQCLQFTTSEESRKARPTVWTFDASYRYVYEAAGGERLLKLAKDVFWALLLAACAWRFATDRPQRAELARVGPLLVVVAYSMAAFLVSVPLNGALIAAAGLRSFLYLFVALLGRWLVPHLGVFAKCVGALLVAELLLLPFELVRGIHMFHEWTPFALASRVVGTLVHPNSMGVFAAAAAAFWYSFSPSRKWFWPMGIVAAMLVLLAGSATGLACMGLALAVMAAQRSGGNRAVVLGGTAVGLALLVAALPLLTGRQDVFDSVWASGSRWTVLRSALFERGVAEVLFGSGLGVNTNAALSLGSMGAPHTPGLPPPATLLPTDSTLTGLVIQIGLAGTLLFYAMLAWAAMRDPLARPFYCIVAVCTLTINVTELFPVNALLALTLAHSAWNPGRRR